MREQRRMVRRWRPAPLMFSASTGRPDKEVPMPLNVVKSAAVRAARTFVQTFLAGLAAGVLGVVDLPTARALVLSVGAAALAAAWRAIDTVPVPTLVDRHATAGVPT